MDYLYKQDLELLESCPPSDYKSYNCECFRWTFNNINDVRNFTSQAKRNPRVLNSKKDFEKCEYHALSFHDTLKNSIECFEFLCNNFTNIRKNIGTHIAKGILNKSDGLGQNIIDKNGHFNFHPFVNNNFKNNFTIYQKL
ncbi:MAG: hypothetical protein RLZZ175_3339 [Bacteroidota bacterium]|jgi:hypothetical protein